MFSRQLSIYTDKTMLFSLPRLFALLREPGIPIRRQAIFDNLCCEERVNSARLREYETFLEQKGLSDDTPFFADKGVSWNSLHDTSFRQRVAVPDSATFTRADNLTARPSIAGGDWIVRIERIDNSFRNWETGSDFAAGAALTWLREWAATVANAHATAPATGKRANSLARLGALMGRPDLPPPSDTVEELFEHWNISVRKDSCPSFVAFEAEMEERLKDNDWPARLCERLGLGHYFRSATLMSAGYGDNPTAKTLEYPDERLATLA